MNINWKELFKELIFFWKDTDTGEFRWTGFIAELPLLICTIYFLVRFIVWFIGISIDF